MVFLRSFRVGLACLGVTSLLWSAGAHAEAGFNPETDIKTAGCMALIDNSFSYGPYDYTNFVHRREFLPVVEQHHFSIDVQLLIKGDSSAYAWDDLVYTVRAFPNHHRALEVMVKHRLADKPLPPGADRIECFFYNAFKFKPGDPQIYLIYGQYLAKSGRHDAALKVFKKHETMKPLSLERDYDMGLLYFDMKQYAKAKDLAEKVYSQNYPRIELKEKLVSVGRWTAARPARKQ